MSIDQHIRITSWNVAGREPPMNASSLDYLFDDSRRLAANSAALRPEIQIVGLQEAPQYLFSDPWSTNLSSSLQRRGYILFKRHKLSGILLYIFVLRELLLRVRDFETESVKTGFGGLLGNKGGVSLRFTVNGNSFSVTNSHLAAHQENLAQRIEDYNSILEKTRYRVEPSQPGILDHEYSFWFGDLNFRFDDIDKQQVLSTIEKAKQVQESSREERVKHLSTLHKSDQLNGARKKGAAFGEFNESLPLFLPTYKFQIGNGQVYDSENRAPAWTDRILYRFNRTLKTANDKLKPQVEQLFYTALPELDVSDHKPIASLFRVPTHDPTKFNPSSVPYEPVKFEPITGWKAGVDGRLWYKISNQLFYQKPRVLSSWDRLALYRADFGSREDFLSIIFVNNVARLAPSLNAQEVVFQSSSPNSRSSSQQSLNSNSSRSNSPTSIPVGVDALTLNTTGGLPPANTSPVLVAARSSPQSSPTSGPQPLPDDAVIGDGFKYFTATFPDDILIPGKYVVLYLKNTAEYNVYGISDVFTIAS